jgi:cysteine desulfurase
MGMIDRPIYLDYNATTPVHPEVVEAMLPYLRGDFGNPSSAHAYGPPARRAVESARELVACLLACQPDEVVFTSGGTEANNLAIRGVAERTPRRHIVTSSVEHPATEAPCTHLGTLGFTVSRVPVDEHGRVRLDAVRGIVTDRTALVTVILAQNETGTLMPLPEVAAFAHSCGALVHTDAAQAVGKVRTRVDELGVDLLSVAGHKLYAPKGVGALYVRRGTPLSPLVRGAGHEAGLRPGTENVAAIAGLGRACELAERDLEAEPARQRQLRDELWERLRAGVPGVHLNGHPQDRLPNTLNVSCPGVRGSVLLAAAPEIAASTGSACHAGEESPSSILLAMGLDANLALGAIRLSLGRSTTREHVVIAASALLRAYAALSGERAAPSA